MMENNVQKIKKTATIILESKENDLLAVNETLNYFQFKFSSIGYNDPFFNTLMKRFNKLKSDYIAGIFKEPEYSKNIDIVKFAIQKYIESNDQFVVTSFDEDYALANKYSQQSFTNEEINLRRDELLKARKLSNNFLEEDVEGSTEFMEKALTNVDRTIHANKIIDKDYLNLKHRYINLKMDLMSGLIRNLSDFHTVLSQIKNAAKLYFANSDNFSNTSLNQNVLRNTKNDAQKTNFLAPFTNEQIYDKFIETLNQINLSFTARAKLDDKVLKAYILLSQEIKERKIKIKNNHHPLFAKINGLLPLT